jgi:hypothetical protein
MESESWNPQGGDAELPGEGGYEEAVRVEKVRNENVTAIAEQALRTKSDGSILCANGLGLSVAATPGAVPYKMEGMCDICNQEVEPIYEAITLPKCGHSFHPLCAALSLRNNSKTCPCCQTEVEMRSCREAAIKLFSHQSFAGGSEFAAECLKQLRAKEAAEQEAQQAKIIEDIRQSGQPGDESQMSSIADVLADAGGQPPEVRLAAVEALRAKVPTFASTWPGLPSVLALLQTAACRRSPDEDANEEAVRLAALGALREVAPSGDEESLSLCCRLLSGASNGCDEPEELRLALAELVQKLALRGHLGSLRAALAALGDASSMVRSTGFGILRRICGPRGDCDGFFRELAPVATGHKESEVRAAAMELISQVEAEAGEDGLAVATAGLYDPDEEVQQAALATLRRLWRRGSPEAVEALTSLACSPAAAVRLRCAALEALRGVAERGDSEAAFTAAMLLGDGEFLVRAAAAQTLKQVCRRGDGQVVGVLLGFLQRRSDEQRLAVEALGLAAGPDDILALGALAGLRDGQDGGDEDLGLRMAAEQALRRIR